MYKKIIFGVVAIVFVSVVYYGISPLFRNTRIDEVAPVSKESPFATSSGAIVETEDSMSEEKSSPSGMKKPVDDTLTQPRPKEELPLTVVSSPIIGTTGHPASGTARIINTEGGAVIRYENFKTLNGPDLFVYLAKDLDAESFINLGELKATEGNVNYAVPTNVDVNEYKYVMVWCRQFGVLFNYADLSLIR